jgi:hypothetical protein
MAVLRTDDKVIVHAHQLREWNVMGVNDFDFDFDLLLVNSFSEVAITRHMFSSGTSSPLRPQSPGQGMSLFS